MEAHEGISVGCTPTAVFVRVVGRATHRNSQPLRALGLDMIQHGHTDFYVDLARCETMDSTFLGVLAGIGLRLREEGQGGSLHLFNVGARNTELLQTLGLHRLMHIEPCSGNGITEQPAESDFHALSDSSPAAQAGPLNQHEAAGLILEAHEDLCRADPQNESRFADVIRLLRESVERDDVEKKDGH